jgi:Cu-Zn family superoxide dismutase
MTMSFRQRSELAGRTDERRAPFPRPISLRSQVAAGGLVETKENPAMRLIQRLAPAAALAALAGCVGFGEPRANPPIALVNTAGVSVGTVETWETPGAVSLRLRASGLPLGIKGVHVHAVGRCDAPRFESAGAHWNPSGRQHGFSNPNGAHAGDLPNVTVAPTGVLQETIALSGASLATLADADGAALVIHAAADDYRTDPSGNSGARIACAVIAPAR